MSEKLTPISRALVAAAKMPAPQARRILMLICESGMTMDVPQPTPGELHYSKREKFIKRMKSSCDRVLDYARHETLRKIEKHFRDSAITSAESGEVAKPVPSLAVRLTFDKALLSDELLAALAEDQQAALATAGQQLFDEIGKDSVWRLPSQDAIQFVQDRANLLANVPDEIHREIMDSIEQGLQAGESRKELMARISAAFDEIGRSRAETIANTETAAAFNYSRDKAMRETGVTHKRWLHSMSPLIKEPRPTHLEADGQTVSIDEPFDVGGVQFMRPTDDSLGAGPEDIINCHCVAIPVEAPIKSGDVEGHPFHGNQWTDAHGKAIEEHASLQDDPRQSELMPNFLDTKNKLSSGQHIVQIFHKRDVRSDAEVLQGVTPRYSYHGPSATHGGRSVHQALTDYGKSAQYHKDASQPFAETIYKISGVHYKDSGRHTLERLFPK